MNIANYSTYNRVVLNSSVRSVTFSDAGYFHPYVVHPLASQISLRHSTECGPLNSPHDASYTNTTIHRQYKVEHFTPKSYSIRIWNIPMPKHWSCSSSCAVSAPCLTEVKFSCISLNKYNTIIIQILKSSSLT